MMPYGKLILVFSIFLIIGGIENTCDGRTFRSDGLEEISRHIAIEWPSGDTTVTAGHGKRDITVRVADGCVEHIGFSIFPQQLRSSIINPQIADFVERYWLSLTLPLDRPKSVIQQLIEDRFTFHRGGVESIGVIQQDTTIMFSCQVDPDLVTMIWGEKSQPVCHITFPVDHELILGRRMLENDRRLPGEINSVRIQDCPTRDRSATSSSLYADTLTSLLVERAGSYLDCALKSERYYTRGADSTALQSVFDSNLYQESLINLFTDYDIEKARDIRLNIRHQIFGLKEQLIETTVQQFVAYSMLNGCMPFVGTVSIDENTGEADVLVIMHNAQLGYNHVLRVSVPLESISTGNGTATARLNAFVPTSNIKNLFKN